MLITRTSPFSGKTVTKDIDVTDDQMRLWQSGVVIQRAMPNVSPDDREFIKTGITSDEWNATFGGDE